MLVLPVRITFRIGPFYIDTGGVNTGRVLEGKEWVEHPLSFAVADAIFF
jgi:hypothetical protein